LGGGYSLCGALISIFLFIDDIVPELTQMVKSQTSQNLNDIMHW
jgi:hypothetical protein